MINLELSKYISNDLIVLFILKILYKQIAYRDYRVINIGIIFQINYIFLLLLNTYSFWSHYFKCETFER